MAYVRPNYPTKAAVKRALAAGEIVTVFQPGPFGPHVPDGSHAFEGPHYPEPHRWYGTGRVVDGKLVSLK
jgi:hypothetical protein